MLQGTGYAAQILTRQLPKWVILLLLMDLLLLLLLRSVDWHLVPVRKVRRRSKTI
jgi:hypothetical protein